jgi:hypothetical protein
MTSLNGRDVRRRGLQAIAAVLALAALAVAGSAPASADRGRRPPATSGNFLLEKGVFTPLADVPGAELTAHVRVNDRGESTGTYTVVAGGTPQVKGFLLDRRRRFTTIAARGALVTVPLGVNNRRQVVGSYAPVGATPRPDTGELFPTYGFLWSKGVFTTIAVPGAKVTAPYEVDDRGQILGNYEDAGGVQHGFLRRKGVYRTIDHPDAVGVPNPVGSTKPYGLNDWGEIVGIYFDGAKIRGFLRSRKGAFTTIEPPGALGTIAADIDNRGVIVGLYCDPDRKLRGFRRDRRGAYTTIPDAPGNRGVRGDTVAFGINDRNQILIPAPDTIEGDCSLL